MEDIKKYIQSKLNNIEAELKRAKSNKVNFIAQKNQLLDMLFLIEIYEKYDISRKNIDNQPSSHLLLQVKILLNIIYVLQDYQSSKHV